MTVPEGVTVIGSAAFLGCYGLREITLPESVTAIADDAFWGIGNVVFRAPAGSLAEAYAKKKGFAFETL